MGLQNSLQIALHSLMHPLLADLCEKLYWTLWILKCTGKIESLLSWTPFCPAFRIWHSKSSTSYSYFGYLKMVFSDYSNNSLVDNWVLKIVLKMLLPSPVNSLHLIPTLFYIFFSKMNAKGDNKAWVFSLRQIAMSCLTSYTMAKRTHLTIG